MVIAVDDFLAAASTPAAMDELYHFLSKKYRVKRLGRPTRYLGWYFHYDHNGDIGLSQKILVDKTLADAGMEQGNPKYKPYLDGVDYHATPDEDEDMSHTAPKFKQLVGDLRYLADCTRPDISYVVGRLERMNKQVIHWSVSVRTGSHTEHLYGWLVPETTAAR